MLDLGEHCGPGSKGGASFCDVVVLVIDALDSPQLVIE